VDNTISSATICVPVSGHVVQRRRWQLQRTSGAFLRLREIRKCVPKFSVVNIVFLKLTVYNTGEMKIHIDKVKIVQFRYWQFLHHWCGRMRPGVLYYLFHLLRDLLPGFGPTQYKFSVHQAVWFHYCSLRHKTCLVQHHCLIQYAPRRERQPYTRKKEVG